MVSTDPSHYRKHYLSIDSVYPSVHALKMFLGKNPDHDFQGADFTGQSILDIGFGDGRDLVLFSELGLETYGVEVDSDVVSHTMSKLRKRGIEAELSVGFNDETGFSANTFDFVYSNAALMYLRNEQASIHKTLKHVFDIVKAGGYLLGSFTRFDSHITKEATRIDENRIVLTDPFYKQRSGQIYWLHNSEEEARSDLHQAGFSKCGIYNYDVDWFGTRETQFIFYAIK